MGVRSRAGIARIVHDLEAQGLIRRRRENGHFYLDVGTNGTGENGSGTMIGWLDVPDREDVDGAEVPFVVPPFMLDGIDASVVRAFRVRDGAFEAEHICEDDVILVELREFARDGQRVVAVLNGTRAVFRKYYRAGADIELRTSDEDAEAIRLPADRIEIRGTYRGLLRALA